MVPRAALSGVILRRTTDAARLDRKETERAERLYPTLHLLAERIQFVFRNQSQRCVGGYASIDKAVPVLDPDECDAVRTGIPVGSRNVRWLALKPLNGSAEITWRGGTSFHIRTPFPIGFDATLALTHCPDNCCQTLRGNHVTV